MALNRELLLALAERRQKAQESRMIPSALRGIDRGFRLGGLGIGATTSLAAPPALQGVPGGQDWLPEPDETLNAFRAFNKLRQEGDWDSAITAAHEEYDAGPGFWGASEMLPTVAGAVAGGGLGYVAPKVSSALKSYPTIAKGVSSGMKFGEEALKMPYRAEEAIGSMVTGPLASAVSKIRNLIRGVPDKAPDPSDARFTVDPEGNVFDDASTETIPPAPSGPATTKITHPKSGQIIETYGQEARYGDNQPPDLQQKWYDIDAGLDPFRGGSIDRHRLRSEYHLRAEQDAIADGWIRGNTSKENMDIARRHADRADAEAAADPEPILQRVPETFGQAAGGDPINLVPDQQNLGFGRFEGQTAARLNFGNRAKNAVGNIIEDLTNGRSRGGFRKYELDIEGEVSAAYQDMRKASIEGENVANLIASKLTKYLKDNFEMNDGGQILNRNLQGVIRDIHTNKVVQSPTIVDIIRNPRPFLSRLSAGQKDTIRYINEILEDGYDTTLPDGTSFRVPGLNQQMRDVLPENLNIKATVAPDIMEGGIYAPRGAAKIGTRDLSDDIYELLEGHTARTGDRVAGTPSSGKASTQGSMGGAIETNKVKYDLFPAAMSKYIKDIARHTGEQGMGRRVNQLEKTIADEGLITPQGSVRSKKRSQYKGYQQVVHRSTRTGKGQTGKVKIPEKGPKKGQKPEGWIEDRLGEAFEREWNRSGTRPITSPLIRSFNQFYRSLKATGDLSALGIHGMLAFYRDVPILGKAAASKVTGGRLGGNVKFSDSNWVRASKLSIDAYRRGEDVIGEMLEIFDARARTSGRLTSDLWARYGLHFGGVETEFKLEIGAKFIRPVVSAKVPQSIMGRTVPERIGKIPLAGTKPLETLLDRANISFGSFGDNLRFHWADDMLAEQLAKGRTLKEIIESGDIQNIADAANNMTGWSDDVFLSTGRRHDIGNMMMFAPRYFQSRATTLARAIEEGGFKTIGRSERVRTIHNRLTGRTSTIQTQQALRSMFELIGWGVMATVTLNTILRNDHNYWDPWINGHSNPNFMTVRWMGNDFSLFGPWIGMVNLLSGVAAGLGGGDLVKIAEGMRGVGSGVVQTIFDNVTGYTFTGDPALITAEEYDSWVDRGLDMTKYISSFMVPIAWSNAAEVGWDQITSPNRNILEKAAGAVSGVAAEFSGGRVAFVSRGDITQEIARDMASRGEIADVPWDKASRHDKDKVYEATAEEQGGSEYTGRDKALLEKRDAEKTQHQDAMNTIAEDQLGGGGFGTTPWMVESARSAIYSERSRHFDALDELYGILYTDAQEEPDRDTRGHVRWQYAQLLERVKDKNGNISKEGWDDYNELSTIFWANLAQDDPKKVNELLDDIRVTEQRYPETIQHMLQAGRYINRFMLDLYGTETNYWNVKTHPLVIAAMKREVPQASQEQITQYMDMPSGERADMERGDANTAALYEKLRKARSKMYSKEGEAEKLRGRFVMEATKINPAFSRMMIDWGYKYPNDNNLKKAMRNAIARGQSFEPIDYTQLDRGSFGGTQ